MRLKAIALPEPTSGLTALARGTLTHRVLEWLWKKIHNQATLLAMPDHSLQQLIDEGINAVFQSWRSTLLPIFIETEKKRLNALVYRWMQLEKQRPDFSVIALEKTITVTINGVTMRLVIDRIDEVAGKQLMIDYKTGKPTVSAWLDPRLDEPQLPLYCISSGDPVHGILFAQIRSDQLAFKGVIEEATLMHRDRRCYVASDWAGKDWLALKADWKQSIETLLNDFMQGVATVDPKKKTATCQYCDLQSLCRIYDVK